MKFFPIAPSLFHPFANNGSAQNITQLLFERTANMEGLQKEFSKLLLQSKKSKEKWLKENQDFIQDMLDAIRSESSLMVHEFMANTVAKSTVIEYMVTVQQTLATLEKLVDDGKKHKMN